MLYGGWATIDRRGRIREAPTWAKPPHRVDKGDLPVGSDDPGRWVYRPASGSILRVKTPGWDSRRQTWHLGGSTVCAMPDSRPELMHVSTDSGRSFRPVPLAGLVPPGGGRVVGCRVTPAGMLLEAVEENPAWLHTVDPDRGSVISSRRLGVELDPWNWDTLADGRLVAATNRPGIMVATDPSNREMRFRPGPVPVGVGFTLLDDEITLVRRHVVHVSRDAGLTWLERDLQLP